MSLAINELDDAIEYDGSNPSRKCSVQHANTLCLGFWTAAVLPFNDSSSSVLAAAAATAGFLVGRQAVVALHANVWPVRSGGPTSAHLRLRSLIVRLPRAQRYVGRIAAQYCAFSTELLGGEQGARCRTTQLPWELLYKYTIQAL